MPDLPIVTPQTPTDATPAAQPATKKQETSVQAYVKYVRTGSNWYGVRADGTRVLLDPATMKPRL